MRPSFEKFKRPTCKGSFALGSACGNCERCDWERAVMRLSMTIPTSESFEWNGELPVSPLDGYRYSMDEMTGLMGGTATFWRKPKPASR